jgi:peptide chain release factor 2
MYLRWSERRGFSVEVLDYQDGEEAGIKDVSIIIKGINAYGYIYVCRFMLTRANSALHLICG